MMRNCLCTSAAFAVLFQIGCSPPASSTPSDPPTRDTRTLWTEPPEVKLGRLVAGEPAQAEVVVHNPQVHAVEVSRIESSCPCIRVTPCWIRIEPGQAATLKVEFDPEDEPDFRGGLAVRYTGMAVDGTTVLEGLVTFVVGDERERR